MAPRSHGRHRAPEAFSPVAELADIVGKATQPAIKTTAVLAASGGLVAAFALPAQASPASGSKASISTTAASTTVTAPELEGPAVQTSFGVIGFAATAKPKAKPRVPERRAPQPASRSTQRVEPPTTTVKAPTKPATGGVLGIAASLEGIMYYYGGTTPETGFDCSGFTQWVFNKVGISLPRTAEQQRQFVTPVSNPQPGDLVFFGAPAYHMGIYAGNGKMWDSPRTGKAVALRDIWSSSVTYGRP